MNSQSSNELTRYASELGNQVRALYFFIHFWIICSTHKTEVQLTNWAVQKGLLFRMALESSHLFIYYTPAYLFSFANEGANEGKILGLLLLGKYFI